MNFCPHSLSAAAIQISLREIRRMKFRNDFALQIHMYHYNTTFTDNATSDKM